MPPLRPDAHRWLADELDKSRYTDGRSLGDILSDWLDSLFSAGSPAAPRLSAILAVILGLLLVVVVIFVLGRLRAGAPARKTSAQIAESDVGPLDDPAGHRRAAEEQRAAGNYPGAVIESFRALVATAADRGAVLLIPGLTAQQAARQLAQLHPELGADLRRAADCFDRARYADARPSGSLVTAEDAAAVAELERRLAGVRHDR
jgi:hypothetical protein